MDDEIFPIGPEGIGRIIRLKNSDSIVSSDNNKTTIKLRVVLDIFVNQYADDNFWRDFGETIKGYSDGDTLLFSEFISEYGKFVAAELIAFILRYSQVIC